MFKGADVTFRLFLHEDDSEDTFREFIKGLLDQDIMFGTDKSVYGLLKIGPIIEITEEDVTKFEEENNIRD